MVLKIPKWIAPLLLLGLFAGVTGTVMAGAAQATVNTVTVHVKQSTLVDHAQDCEEGETSAAHFVITQIGEDRPDSIEVTIDGLGTVTVNLLKLTGDTAHYEVATQGGLVTDATAKVPYDWTGQFNLSHYVCGGDETSTTTTTLPSTTSTTSSSTSSSSSSTTTTTPPETTTSTTTPPETTTTTTSPTTTTSSTTSVPSTSTTSTTTSTSPAPTTSSVSTTTTSTSETSTAPVPETSTSSTPDTRRTTPLAHTGSETAKLLALAGVLLSLGSLVTLALRPRKH